MTTRRKIILAACSVAAALLVSMMDRVQLEGDHVSYLVLAPHPTWRFACGGGEEGAWRRAHPGLKEPWWLAGRYFILMELTGP